MAFTPGIQGIPEHLQSTGEQMSLPLKPQELTPKGIHGKFQGMKELRAEYKGAMRGSALLQSFLIRT